MSNDEQWIRLAKAEEYIHFLRECYKKGNMENE